MTGADQPGPAPDPPPSGPLAAGEYDTGPPLQPVRRRAVSGTVLAAALTGGPFLIAFIFLAVVHHLSAFGGIAWGFAGALGIPALGITGAAWWWRRLSHARREGKAPGPPASLS